VEVGVGWILGVGGGLTCDFAEEKRKKYFSAIRYRVMAKADASLPWRVWVEQGKVVENRD
jgi:hypothetical protein